MSLFRSAAYSSLCFSHSAKRVSTYFLWYSSTRALPPLLLMSPSYFGHCRHQPPSHNSCGPQRKPSPSHSLTLPLSLPLITPLTSRPRPTHTRMHAHLRATPSLYAFTPDLQQGRSSTPGSHSQTLEEVHMHVSSNEGSA